MHALTSMIEPGDGSKKFPRARTAAPVRRAWPRNTHGDHLSRALGLHARIGSEDRAVSHPWRTQVVDAERRLGRALGFDVSRLPGTDRTTADEMVALDVALCRVNGVRRNAL